MTLPAERSAALEMTRAFLLRLATAYTPDGIKKIPTPVRQEARRLLKHYPDTYDIYLVGKACPTIFSPDFIQNDEA